MCACVCMDVGMPVPYCICALVSGLRFCVGFFRLMQDLLILFANFYKNAVAVTRVCMRAYE